VLVKVGASVVATGGVLAIAGFAGGTLTLRPGVGNIGIPMETRVVVPFWGTRAELAEVIALARAGRISAHVERFSLDKDRPYAERSHRTSSPNDGRLPVLRMPTR
jgi:propanol-preferring alcohol dehydrogenase